MYAFLRSTLLLSVVLALAGCAQFTERSTGVVDDKLTVCPQWPRCVSSQARDPEKKVEPLVLTAAPGKSWLQVIDVVRNMPRTEIQRSTPTYLHAEVTSPWGFYTDDLELLRDGPHIEVRSSARIGYFDFNVNRDRVEALRVALREQGLVN